MLEIVSKLGCNYIMTHMPDEHQKGINKDYKNILEDLDAYFNERIKSCTDKGIDKDKIIIDPGIGFGKSGHDNITILENIDYLKKIHSKICIGTSNKRYSSTLFNGIETKNDLKVANVASSTLCALKEAAFLRVHDVGITKDAILIVNKVKSV
jgi:dihydropteroate synthase